MKERKKMKKIIPVALFVLITVVGVPFFAHAALIDRGNGLIYDSELNITWLQNANLSRTNTFGVAGISAPSGQMGWETAMQWIATMNAANYLGYSNWRLPQTLPVNGTSYNYGFNYNGSSDLGYNISAPGSAYPDSKGSELAYLYYVELGNKGGYGTNGNSQSGYGVTNAGPFINLANLPVPGAVTTYVIFWSGTPYSGASADTEWSFRYDDGMQYAYDIYHAFYVWPVLPGDPAGSGTDVLTVTTGGTGSGTVTTSPSGQTFRTGTSVTLTANADPGSYFAGWSGGCSGTSSICTLTMNANTTVNATFTNPNLYIFEASETDTSNATEISHDAQYNGISGYGTSVGSTVTVKEIDFNVDYIVGNLTGYTIAVNVWMDSGGNLDTSICNGTIAGPAILLGWNAITNLTGSCALTANTKYDITLDEGGDYKAASVAVYASATGAQTIPGQDASWFSNKGLYDTSNNAMDFKLYGTYLPLTQYTITASAGSGGGISPSGSVQVGQGGSQSYTITPNANYQIAGVTVDGTPVGGVSSYTFSNVTANHTIAATFTATATYTITSTASAGGSISPSGSTIMNQGVSQTYTITPNAGYQIADVTVDGKSVGALATYTFNNVTANHTIAATFTAGNYILEASATGTGNGGTEISHDAQYNGINGYTTSVGYTVGEIDFNVNYIVGNLTGYTIAVNVWTDSGGNLGASICRGTIAGSAITPGWNAITNLTGSCALTANTKYDITLDEGGDYQAASAIVYTSATGAQTIPGQDARWFSNKGLYDTSNNAMDFKIYGENVSSTQYTITASAGSGGGISPSGAVTVNSGGSQTFTITPNSGYSISSVIVDGASVGAVSTYTFNNVTANHTIAATFTAGNYILEASETGTGNGGTEISHDAQYNGINGYTTSVGYTVGEIDFNVNYIVGDLTGYTIAVNVWTDSGGNLGTSICSGTIAGSAIAPGWNAITNLTGSCALTANTKYDITLDEGGDYQAASAIVYTSATGAQTIPGQDARWFSSKGLYDTSNNAMDFRIYGR